MPPKPRRDDLWQLIVRVCDDAGRATRIRYAANQVVAGLTWETLQYVAAEYLAKEAKVHMRMREADPRPVRDKVARILAVHYDSVGDAELAIADEIVTVVHGTTPVKTDEADQTARLLALAESLSAPGRLNEDEGWVAGRHYAAELIREELGNG